MYLWIAMCMRAHLSHVAFEISDHSPNFLDTPRMLHIMNAVQQNCGLMNQEMSQTFNDL
jgi:hypothetical protein